MALLSVTINYSLKELLYKKKEAVLFHQAEQLTAILQENPQNSTLFDNQVTYNRKLSKVKMALLTKEDPTTSPKLQKQENKLIKKGDIEDPNIIKEVFSGKRITHIGTFEKGSNKELVTIGIPIKENAKIIGALFLYTPVKEVQTAEVSKIIWIVSAVITIPAILALFWISRKISTPLVQMTQAASSIGKGNFNKRILVDSVDEVGQLAVTFNNMADQLAKLESMRKELIRNVSHELRTPLTSVRGFIQGLLDGVIPLDQQKKYLTISFQEIERLSNLLNTMLDFSAIESGKVTLQAVTIQWEPLVKTVTESIRVRMEEKKISLGIQFEDAVSLSVFADPERMKQVLFNLLDNAVRHTPNGGIIQMTSKKIGPKLEVNIFNSGDGIAPESLSLIWEPFYTEDWSRQSHRERSGLGLPITKQLIERMGGKISVHSIPGEGVTFTFSVPSSNH